MELRNLISFIRAAELQSFSKTAEQLGYSQSAVTMQLKQLEEELGIPLFERIGKRVKLTQAGERFLPRALEVLEAVGRAQQVAQEPERPGGRLRIGTCQSLVSGLLPPVMRELSRLCPQAEVTTCTALVPDLLQMLRQNDADLLLFLDQQLYYPEWVKVAQRPEPIHFVASSASPLAGMESIPLERLLQEPLYLTEKGISYRYAVEQFLAEQGRELRPFWEVGGTDVITRFLLEGEGISLLPEFVVREHLEKGELVVLHPQCPPHPHVEPAGIPSEQVRHPPDGPVPGFDEAAPPGGGSVKKALPAMGRKSFSL